jgi:hypothetical protein
MKKKDTVKILAERSKKCVEWDLEIDSKVRQKLLNIARRDILKDEDALLAWIVVKAIKNGIEKSKKLTAKP